MDSKKILVVDDHPFVRSSIIKELEMDASYEVCGEAGTVSDALKLIDEKHPDFVIVDMSLEDGSGIEIIEYSKEHYPDCISIVISMYEEPAYIEKSLEAGAKGYIFKRESVQSVLQSLECVQQGKIYMSQRVNEVLVRQHSKNEQAKQIHNILSERELEVFEQFGKGLTRSQIAEELFISVRTVDSHLDRIKNKLNCKRMAQLIRIALQHNLAKSLQ